MPTARLPIDAAHRAASADAHDVSAIAGAMHLERTDLGGQVPLRLRLPTLGIHRVWPMSGQQYEIAWADGNILYAFRGTAFLKSTDTGETWTTVSTVAFEFDPHGCFLRLATGTLLAVEMVTNTPAQYAIWRSADDGVTWTKVHDFRAGTLPLQAGAWCEDGNGHVYYGEYQATDDFADINVYRSTDDGATFTVFYTFPGGTTADPDKIRHVHACNLDPVSGRVFVSCGDTWAAGGLYRTNAAGDSLEAVITNASGGANLYHIGVMFFDDYIAWISDGMPGKLYRLARSEFGEASPALETIYTVQSAGWSAHRVADDNSWWIASAAPEVGAGIDGALHLFAVTDNGASVHELGSIPTENGYASLSVIGSGLNNDGAVFWFRTRLLDPDIFVEAELLRSTVALLDPRRNADLVPVADVPETWSLAVGSKAVARAYDTAVGHDAFGTRAAGVRGTAVGSFAAAASQGSDVTAYGAYAANEATSAYQIVAIGSSALRGLTEGSRDVAIGHTAGRFAADGTTPVRLNTYSTFIGYATKASANGRTNETVIGANAVGGGSNTVRLGNASVTAWLPGASNVCSLGNAATAFRELYLHDGADEWKVTIDTSGTLVTTKV